MTHLYKYLFSDSSKNSTFILKNSPNIRYSSRYLTRYSTRYSTRGRVTQPQSNNFTIQLQLDLGHQLLVFASTTNLESGPGLADTWYHVKIKSNEFYSCLKPDLKQDKLTSFSQLLTWAMGQTFST